jgi:hypothetical protein
MFQATACLWEIGLVHGDLATRNVCVGDIPSVPSVPSVPSDQSGNSALSSTDTSWGDVCEPRARQSEPRKLLAVVVDWGFARAAVRPTQSPCDVVISRRVCNRKFCSDDPIRLSAPFSPGTCTSTSTSTASSGDLTDTYGNLYGDAYGDTYGDTSSDFECDYGSDMDVCSPTRTFTPHFSNEGVRRASTGDAGDIPLTVFLVESEPCFPVLPGGLWETPDSVPHETPRNADQDQAEDSPLDDFANLLVSALRGLVSTYITTSIDRADEKRCRSRVDLSLPRERASLMKMLSTYCLKDTLEAVTNACVDTSSCQSATCGWVVRNDTLNDIKANPLLWLSPRKD